MKPSKKMKQRERRTANRHGFSDVGEYRTWVSKQAAAERAGARRRRRDAEETS